MPSLAEIQRDMRAAVVSGDMHGLLPLVVGGGDPSARVRIHHRHYHASLVEAVVAKHPATAWLVGMAFLRASAEAYVRQAPPRVLCVAEYGAGFPAIVGAARAAGPPPYVRWFAELEQHLGHVALAVDEPVLDISAVSAMEPDALFDTAARLQSGLCYLHAPWPVDELMRLYLTETAPEAMALEAEDVWVEVRGARGEFTMRRLDPAQFTFRRSLQAGLSLGQAAEAALETGATFEAGASFTSLFDDGLIVAMAARQATETS